MEVRNSNGDPACIIVDTAGSLNGRKSGTLALTAPISSIATAAIIDVSNCKVLYVQFTIAVATLSAFHVDIRCHPSGTYFAVAAAAGDYTTPNAPVLAASSDLTVSVVGSHWLKLDVAGIESVRIQIAGTASTFAGYYGAQ